MKVLYVNSLYPPHVGGGAEIALAGIVQGFRQRGQDVAVLTTHGGAGLSRDVVDGVPVHRIGSKNIYWQFPPQSRSAPARTLWHAIDSYNLPMARQAAAVIDEVRPDLVVCHNLPGLSVAVWASVARRRIPLVQVLHDYYTLCPKVTMFKSAPRPAEAGHPPRGSSKVAKPHLLESGSPCAGPCGGCAMFRLPHRRASNAVSAVIGVSQAVLDTHLENGLFASASVKAVVHNARAMPPAFDRSVAAGASVFTFGYIGGLTEIKGVQQLAQAFEQVARSSARPMQLLIAGTGKADVVAQLRREHGSARVRFVGHAEPAEFFAGLDVCVVPSLWNEPLGMVVFEAIAAGVPVIGSRRGGIPEMIRHEVNGLLFDPDEAGALERALARVLDQPELLASMRRVGRASVAHFLDPKRMLDEYDAIYRRLMQGVSRSAPEGFSAAGRAGGAVRLGQD